MSLVNFTYTKSDGNISERAFVPLHIPFEDYFGIDVTELSEEDQALFAAEIKTLQDLHNKAITSIMEEYDIKHNYRKFLKEKMSDITIENF